ncbi:hypothetical protein [Bacillus sp. 179-C3.3 HS]|uniref:hypothetical protein n=1 Tax=Bacillus sp. 179-C3.3 HS TaxID=3232162 RepID=UPI0039A26CD0
MQNHVEKELFLLSWKHAFTALYFMVIPLIIQTVVVSSSFSIMITLYILHNLLESVIWFYKSRKVRNRQIGDLSQLGQTFVQIAQRIEQLMMISGVIFFITEIVRGGVDLYFLIFPVVLFVVVLLQHLQFYYVQFFFKSKSWFAYTLSLRKLRPSRMVRERRAMKRSVGM